MTEKKDTTAPVFFAKNSLATKIIVEQDTTMTSAPKTPELETDNPFCLIPPYYFEYALQRKAKVADSPKRTPFAMYTWDGDREVVAFPAPEDSLD